MRTVLVTGHTKGIGYAICNALLDAGHNVIGVARSSLPDRAGLQQFSADLSDASAVEMRIKEIVKSIRANSGTGTGTGTGTNASTTAGTSTSASTSRNATPIDAIVCNAGAGQFGALENFSASQIQTNLQLNLISPLVILKILLPALKQHQRSDIIFIASESALQGGRYGSVYSAGKFGIRGAAQALRYECANSNCHVGIVNPGMVRTDFFNDLNFEPGREEQHALQATDIANAVMTMLNAPNNAVIEEINVSPLQHVVQKKP